MAFSSNTFSRLYNFLNERVNNEKIKLARFDAEMDGVATGLTELATGAVGIAGYTKDTKADVEAASVPAIVLGLRTLGYSAADDGGGALYQRVGSEPSHEGKIQDALNNWWEYVPEGGQVAVRAFGAPDLARGGSGDAGPAINNAFAFLKAKLHNVSAGGAIKATPHVLWGGNGIYDVQTSLNLTGEASARNIKIANFFIFGKCANKVVLDVTGSRYFKFEHVHVWGDATDTPYSLLQICRPSDGASAGSHHFSYCSFDGHATNAAVHNYAAEGVEWDHCRIWLRKANVYALIMDGEGTKTCISDYVTPLASTAASNIQHCFIQGDIRNLVAGPAMYFSSVSQVDMVNSYAVTIDDVAIDAKLDTANRSADWNLGLHIEKDGMLGLMRVLGSGTVGLYGLRWWDIRPQCNNQIFVIHTDITQVTFYGIDIRIDQWWTGGVPTNKLFDTPSKVRLRGGRILIPTIGGFNKFSDFNEAPSVIVQTQDVSRSYQQAIANYSDDASGTRGTHSSQDNIRASASPADGDHIFSTRYLGNNDAAASKIFAELAAYADTITAGSEDGRLDVRVMRNGTETVVMSHGPTVNNSLLPLQVSGANVYYTGGTDVAVADGGSGSSTPAGARTNLELTNADILGRDFTPSHTGGVARTLRSKVEEVVSLHDVGAIGDGTDVTSKINGLIDDLTAAGGLIIVPPAESGSFYRANGIILKSNVYIIGRGMPEIRASADGGESVIESDSFQSLTGTNTAGGIENAGLINLYINGNRPFWTVAPSATKGHGVALYGRDLHLERLKIYRAYRTGLWTEYADNTGGGGISPFNLHVSNILIDSVGDHGWRNAISDSHMNDMNVRGAGLNTDNTFNGVYLAPSGNTRGSNLNVWSPGSASNFPKYAVAIETFGADITNATIESGRTANLFVDGNHNDITGLVCLNMRGPDNIIVRGSRNRIDAYVENSTFETNTKALVLGVSGDQAQHSIIHLRALNQPDGFLDVTESGGNNHVVVRGFNNSGVSLVGTPTTTDRIDMSVTGGGGAVIAGGRAVSAVALGNAVNASAVDSAAIGRTATASATGAVALGHNVTASGDYSLATGRQTEAFLYGERAHQAGQTDSTADAELRELIARNTTTDDTETTLFLDGSAARLDMPTGTTWGFEILLVGRQTAGTGFGRRVSKITGAITKGATAGSTTLNGTPTETLINDVAAWSVSVTADTTNGALKIAVTGEASKTIKWVAYVKIVQVRT